MNYGDKWRGYLARITYTKIKEVATTYNTLDFFDKREEINDKINTELVGIVKQFMGETIEIIGV